MNYMKMRKKFIFPSLLFSIIFATLILTSCSPHKEKKIVYLGINAEIVDVDEKNQILTIIGLGDGNTIFPTETKIDCSSLEEDGKIFKMKSSTNIVDLHFNDLKITDKIKINVSDKELNNQETSLIKIEQIELLDEN